MNNVKEIAIFENLSNLSNFSIIRILIISYLAFYKVRLQRVDFLKAGSIDRRQSSLKTKPQ